MGESDVAALEMARCAVMELRRDGVVGLEVGLCEAVDGGVGDGNGVTFGGIVGSGGDGGFRADGKRSEYVLDAEPSRRGSGVDMHLQ